MSDCTILIDTNLALHFRPMEQIDWLQLTGCARCTIAITPVLMRELEHQKVFNKSAALRARASRTIDFLFSRMQEPDPVELRAGTVLAFLEQEPSIDFEAAGLSRSINDDHYIASALEHLASTGDKTLIASNDGGIAMKLRSRAVDVLRLPEDHRLPAEVDAEQKELRDAKAELARMRAAKPKLAVEFSGGLRHLQVDSPARLLSRTPGLAAIHAKHPKLAARRPRPDATLGALGQIGGLTGYGSVLHSERDADHGRALDLYYSDYSRFLSEEAEWLDRLRLSETIALTLVNEGGAAATNVDVTVRFPAGIELVERGSFPARPKPPKAPPRPGTIGAAIANARHLDLDIGSSFAPRLYDGAMRLPEGGRLVRFSANAVKPKCELRLDEFTLCRTPTLGTGGIEIEVEVTFNEGDPVTQKLAMSFSENRGEVDVAAVES